MGDLSKFIPPQTSIPFRSSSQKVTTRKTLIPESSNKKPRVQNIRVQQKIKKEQKQIQEDKETLANLESAIPQSNVGFKMLQKMGYILGSPLGKEGSGIAEPVGLVIRRGRGGLGREDPAKEKIRMDEERVSRERRSEEELMAEFGNRQKEQWRTRQVSVSFYKAKAVLEQLENNEVIIVEKSEYDDDGENVKVEEEEITEEDLLEVLMKLRDEFKYCLFCGCQYESEEALLSNCPGTDEDEH